MTYSSRLTLVGMKHLKTFEELEIENRNLHLQLKEAGITKLASVDKQVNMKIVYQKKEPKIDARSSEDQMSRSIVEKMNQGVVTLDQNGVIMYGNSKFAAMVELPLNKIIGSSLKSFISTSDLDTFNETLVKAWGTDCIAELDIFVVKGKATTVQVSLFTVLPGQLAVIFTELTGNRKTEEVLLLNNQKLSDVNLELTSSNNDLMQFASVASHDLQEPLRKIQIFATMLRDRHGSELTGDGSIFLDKIISSSGRMTTMIYDILNYSRLSSNTDGFVLTNLNDIVTEVLDDYEIVIGEKQAEITVGKLPVIEVNRGQIRQVFQNLISNALKFSKETISPIISIAGTEDEDAEYCTITITDNGIGFNDKHGDKIFSLFQRLNGGAKYEGSGIGLATTRKIIDKHHGTIEAKSREGEGSVFSITLPIRHYKSVW